jgi:phage terminase large subunit GpA-like protein
MQNRATTPAIKVVDHPGLLQAVSEFFSTLRPPPTLGLTEWSDRFRKLSRETSARPGRWRTERQPLLGDIMDAITDPNVVEAWALKPSQFGWTEVINNVVGYFMHQDPTSILVVQPTVEMAEAWSTDRLAPMVRDSPALTGLIADPKSRNSGNKILHKQFPGGQVDMVGANAPSGLASRPKRVVLYDEVDRYPVSAGTEGDPIRLARKRQTTFWNRKTIGGSTPTRKGFSRIEREYERSDMRVCHVACPYCDVFQPLRWEQVKWDKAEDGKHLFDTAHYQCDGCGELWTEGDRLAAIDNRKWVATRPFEGIAGFRFNALYSKLLEDGLAGLVREFLDCRKSPELLQTFVNTVLGESWEEQGEGLDPNGFMHRLELFDHDTLSDFCRLVTMGVDVQGNRLEAQWIAWGEGEESWPCRYEVILGDPSQPDVWRKLTDMRRETLVTETGRPMRVKACCIDMGGHHAAEVLSYAKAYRREGVYATKGMSGPRPIWPKRGTRSKTHSLQFYAIGVDTAKDAIYGRLKIRLGDGEEIRPGYVHFPAADGFDAEYFAQLTVEKVLTRFREGRPYRIWECPKGARNEALDTFVLAMAARLSTNIRLDRPPAPERASRSRPAPRQDGAPAPTPPPPQAATKGPTKRRSRVAPSSYMG